MEFEREDMFAAFLLAWLKYTPVTEKDIQNMKNIDLLEKERIKNLEKSKRNIVRISNDENQETPDVELTKRVRNAQKKSSGFNGVDGVGDSSSIRKRVRDSSSGLMNLQKKSSDSIDGNSVRNLQKNSSGFRGVGGVGDGDGDSSSIRKSVRDSSSGLINLQEKSSGSSSIDGNLVRKSSSGLMNKQKNSSGFSGVDGVGDGNPIQKRVRNSSSGLMNLQKKSSGSSSIDGNLVRNSSSGLMNLQKNPSGFGSIDGVEDGNSNPIQKKVRHSHATLMNKQKKSSGFSSFDDYSNRIPKRMSNSPSGLRNSSGFSSIDGAGAGAGYSNINPKRLRNLSSGLMNFPSGSSSIDGNSNSIPKRMRILSSGLMNLSKIPSWSLPKFPPIENIATLIGQCSNPVMKQLTKSDVDDHQGRLLLNTEDVRKHLLPLLNEETEVLANGIEVQTFVSMGKYYKMTFKTWGNNKVYVLVGSWKSFVNEHKLKENDCVTVWMFRHNRSNKLCFALTWKRGEDDADVDDDQEEEEEEKIQGET